MFLVAIAWLYVALMMAAAEAASPGGTLLGAFFTLLLYGLLPLAIALYLLNTPARRARRRAREAAARATVAREARPASSGQDPGERRHATGDPVPTEREEP
jgi:hypothetical protein